MVYSKLDADGLSDNQLLPSGIVCSLFNLYMDSQSSYRLKRKILEVLIAILDKDFLEQHFDFGNKDMFERVKKDFLSESVPKEYEPLFYKLYQEIVNFLIALFEFNDCKTNCIICEDIKMEYILMETLVNYKQSPKVLISYLVPDTDLSADRCFDFLHFIQAA